MYSLKFRKRALKIIKKHGGCCNSAAKEIGGVSPRTLTRWKAAAHKTSRKRCVHLDADRRQEVVEKLLQGYEISKLAESYQVSTATIYNIRREAHIRGRLAPMDMREHIEIPRIDPRNLPDDVGELKRRCAELEMDNAILKQTIEILKKDPGACPQELSNKEKMLVVGALKKRYSVSSLCARLGMPRSSYYYSRKASTRPDRYVEARKRVRESFERSKYTFGSERIWQDLRSSDSPLVISEKVVRRLMREEGLHVIYNRTRRHYSSYKGEIRAHPGNLVERSFCAKHPNELWLTDITQFSLPSGKCYLSAIVDCFDGKIAAWRLLRAPMLNLPT